MNQDNPIANAIIRRLLARHKDIFNQYGLEDIENAIWDVASMYKDWDEIGSSDVSAFVNEVLRNLADQKHRISETQSTDYDIGDPVIITGNVQFHGSTGEVVGFDSTRSFVVVDLYNHGKKSFHTADVSYNDYADSDEEEAYMYDKDKDFRDYMSRQLDEKKLSKAEKKKREQIAKAIEKDNPKTPMGKKMAIATATAKRVAEGKQKEYWRVHQARGLGGYAERYYVVQGYGEDMKIFTNKYGAGDFIKLDDAKAKADELNQGIREAIKIGSKVRMHGPGKDYHDQIGMVGEIRHGLYKGAPKTYTVDYGDRQSVQLRKNQIRIADKKQSVAEATGNPGMPHDFSAVQPGLEVWYKGRFAGWTTGKVYDDPYGKSGKMISFEPNPSEFPGDGGRILSLPYDEISLRKSTSIGKLKGTGQGVAEGKEELHAQLQSINQKLKLMRGGPVGEPNSMAFVEKRKALLKQKEQILSQLKQGVAEGKQLDEISAELATRVRDKANSSELDHLIKAHKKIQAAKNIPLIGSKIGQALAKKDLAQAERRGRQANLADRKLGGLGKYRYDDKGQFGREGPAKVLATRKEVREAAGLYGPFTVTINTGERPKARIKTKKFRQEDDAILWAQDWLENFPQYSLATAEVADSDGNVVWTTDESLGEQANGVTEAKSSTDKISTLEKKIQGLQDKLGLARERRKMKGQRQQGQSEIKIQNQIDDLRNEIAALKKANISEGMNDRRVFNDYREWKRAASELEADDDGRDFVKLDGNLIAKWYEDRNYGWVDDSTQTVGESRDSGDDMWESKGSSAKIASLEKKIQTLRDRLGLARERRKMKGQHQQGQSEIKIQRQIDDLNIELTQLKKEKNLSESSYINNKKIELMHNLTLFKKGRI